MIALHPFSTKATGGQVHLRIMETTDLHMHICPYDYYADKEDGTIGLARAASAIEHLRGSAENSVLLDNGDFLQGNPMGDYIALARGLRDQDTHPMIAAMNAIGYDAATLGNHEFNYGLDFLTKALRAARFPIVSANAVLHQGAESKDDKTLVPPYVLLPRVLTDGNGAQHPITIGILGLLPPQITTWDRRHLEGKLQARDILQTARNWVPMMRKAGADLIIALSHSGIDAAQPYDGMENASLALAAIDGIDVVLAGHTHQVFPSDGFSDVQGVDSKAGTFHGKPAVMAGFWGSHLGVIDLMLTHDDHGWSVEHHKSQALPVYQCDEACTDTETQSSVQKEVSQDHSETLAYIRRPVGKTQAPLHSYFALVMDDPSLNIVSAAQRWYTSNKLQGSGFEHLPVLSAAAPFKSGGRSGPGYFTDVPAGDIAIKNVADLYVYPNTIRALRITGAQLRNWLERSAGLFHQIKPGQRDQDLLHPDFPSYNFDVINGVQYQIDPSQPNRYDRTTGALIDADAHRIRNLCHMGKPVHDDDEFIVATNSYRANGGGYFPGADGSTVIFESPDTNRDVIIRYIVEHGTPPPAPDLNWRLAPLPGTSVLFQTGPGARKYAQGIQGLMPAGPSENGFVRFRLEL